MSLVSDQAINALGLSEKELKYHATQLQVWLWQNLNTEPWTNKLACGKALTELSLRMVPLKTDTNVLKNWAMIVAMMLNGTEHIYGDPDPFTMERGKSPEAQAWRLLTIMALGFVPGEGYLISNVSRIALSTIDLPFEFKLGVGKSCQEYGADIIHYLNYEGQGNSIAWFLQLNLNQHKATVLERVQAVLTVWQQSFACFSEQIHKPSAFADCLTRQKYALQAMINQAPKMIAPALQNIAGLLKPLQQMIPPRAEKELGARAAIPYQLKQMIPNSHYVASATRAEIDAVFANYFPPRGTSTVEDAV
ncbi:hypothetical protein AAKU64_000019 [Undibacterium sp. GrIS 1.8]|uniref:hypothetical protein n=1 Tax=unclassified Undibacterium TaxID=2630295 RepID=UPI0033994E41